MFSLNYKWTLRTRGISMDKIGKPQTENSTPLTDLWAPVISDSMEQQEYIYNTILLCSQIKFSAQIQTWHVNYSTCSEPLSQIKLLLPIQVACSSLQPFFMDEISTLFGSWCRIFINTCKQNSLLEPCLKLEGTQCGLCTIQTLSHAILKCIMMLIFRKI